MNPEFIINIIVRARHELAGVMDSAAREVDRLTGAQDKQTTSQEKATKVSKELKTQITELQTTYKKFTDDVAAGTKDYDATRLGLARLAQEMDKLQRKTPIGSRLSEDLHKSALGARNLIRQLETAQAAERKLMEQQAADRTRAEQERQRMVEARRQREIKAAEDISKAEIKAEKEAEREAERSAARRSAFVMEILDAVRERDAEIERNERSLADEQIREQARVESARAQARIDWERKGIGVIERFEERVARSEGLLDRLFSFSPERQRELDRLFDNFERQVAKNRFSVAALDNRLRGMVYLGVIVFFQQLVSLAGVLASTFVSLASTAVQAGAAIGGAFTAGIAQAVPMIGLLIAAFGRVGAVFKAVEQAQKAALRSGRDNTAAMERQRETAGQVQRANEGLAEAHRRVAEAQDAVTRAREQAQRQLEDMMIAERDAARGVSAAISSGDVDALEEQQRRLTRTQEDIARDAPDGTIDRMPGVVAAERAVAEANRGVERARDQLEEARTEANTSAAQVATATAALNELLGELTPTERSLYEALRSLQDTYKRVFRPITDIIIAAFTDSVDRIREVLSDERIIEPLTRLANRMAESVRTLTIEFTSGPWLEFFGRMADEMGRNLGPLTEITIQISRLFRNIADAASPALREFLGYLNEMFTRAAEATAPGSGMDKLTDWFMQGEGFAEDFINLGLAITQLFLAIIGASSESGATAIQDFTGEVQLATEWINAHQESVTSFFEDARKVTYMVAGAIWALVEGLAELYHPEFVGQLAEAFEETFLPALIEVAKVVGIIANAFLSLATSRFGGPLVEFVLVTALLTKTLRPLVLLLSSFVLGLAQLTRLPRLAGAAMTAFTIATGPAGKVIAAVAAMLILLSSRIEPLGDAMRWLGDHLEIVAPALLLIGTRMRALGAAGGVIGGLTVAIRGLGAAFRALAGGAGIGAAITAFRNYVSAARAARTGTAASGVFIDPRRGPQAPAGGSGGGVVAGARGRLGGAVRGIGGTALLFGALDAFMQQSDPIMGRLSAIERAGEGVNKVLLGIPFGLAKAFKPDLLSPAERALEEVDRKSRVVLENVAEWGRKWVRQGNIRAITEEMRRIRRLTDDGLISQEAGQKAIEILRGIRRAARDGRDMISDMRFAIRGLRDGVSRNLPEVKRLMDDALSAIRGRPGLADDQRKSEMARVFEASIRDIRRLAEAGRIPHQVADEEIKKLRREQRLRLGEDAERIGIDFARGIEKGKTPTRRSVQNLLSELDKMPSAARRIAGATMIAQSEELERKRKLPEGSAKRIAFFIGERFRDMRHVGVRQASELARGLAESMFSIKGGTHEGMRYVFDTTSEALKALGGNPPSITIKKPGRPWPVYAAGTGDRVGGSANTIAGIGMATGGWIGRMGERGKDAVQTWLGRGEVVLNHWQQRAVQAAMSGRDTLYDIVRRTRGFHAGGPDQPGMSGGFAGTSPSGNRTVPIPGFPGEYIAASVLGPAMALIRKFKLFVTDAFATAGHRGAGHLQFGTAMDVVPGPGGSWNLVDAAVAAARRAGLTVLYNGVAGHGRGHHAHIELKPGAGIEGGGRGADAAVEMVKRVLVGGRGPGKEIVQRALDRVRRAANRKIQEEGGGDSGDRTPHPAFDGPWTKVMEKIARSRGWDLGAWKTLVQKESGGNPAAVNPSSGAFGLGQFLGATARAYAKFGALSRDGAQQIFAMAKYIADRYGNPTRALAFHLAHNWYDKGGEIPGADGQPVPITAHAKEWVLNKIQQSKVANWLGTSVDQLRGALGFTGGPQSFQGGGEVRAGQFNSGPRDLSNLTDEQVDKLAASYKKQEEAEKDRADALEKRAKEEDKEYEELKKRYERVGRLGTLGGQEAFRQMSARRFGRYEAPTIPVRSVGEAVDEAQLILRAVRALTERNRIRGQEFVDRAVKTLNELAREGGALDQFNEVVQRRISELSTGVQLATLRVRRGRVVQTGTDAGRAGRELNLLERGTGFIRRELRLGNRGLGRVDALIRRVRRGGVDDDEIESYQRLITLRRNFLDRINAANESLAQNLQERLGKQQEIEQAQIERINNRFTRRLAVLVGRFQRREIRGESDGQLGNLERQQRTQRAQRDALRRQLRRTRDPDTRQDLREQIDQLRTTIRETGVSYIQEMRRRIEQRSSRRDSFLEITRRLADLTGNRAGVTWVIGRQIDSARQQIFGLQRVLAEANRRGLKGQAAEIEQQIAELNMSVAEMIAARFDNGLEIVNRGIARRDAWTQIRTRVAEVLGQKGAISNLIGEQISNAGKSITELRSQLAEAQRLGLTDQVQAISEQIMELNVSIIELTAQRLQNSIEAVNEQAQRSMTGLDLRGRLADLRERGGDFSGAFAERGRILAERGNVMATQRGGLANLLMNAMLQGNEGAAQSLRDQIAELDVAMQENTAAIAANTVATRQASIDQIINRGGFLGGVFGGLNSLITALGSLQGSTNADLIRALIGQAGTTLGQTGASLREELFQGFGIDTRGLDPTALAEMLRSLNYDGITADFSLDQRQQFESLINAIIENATAVVQNTEQLNQINNPNLQNWSTTAWRWFRNAVFTGAGGLLPQYQIPSMDAGGDILRDGLIYAHQGEKVVRAAQVRLGDAGGDFHSTIMVEEKVEEADPDVIANRMMFRYQNRPKSRRTR